MAPVMTTIRGIRAGISSDQYLLLSYADILTSITRVYVLPRPFKSRHYTDFFPLFEIALFEIVEADTNP